MRRKVLRNSGRYLLAAMILVAAVVYPLQNLIPITDFGFFGDNGLMNSPSTTVHVLTVSPGTSAQRAGLRPGDELPLRNVDRRSRAALAYVKAGDTATFDVRRGTTVQRVTLVAQPDAPLPFGFAALLRAIVNFTLACFALIIIIRAWNTEFGPIVATLTALGMIDAAFDALPWTAQTVNPAGIALLGYNGGIDAAATIAQFVLIALIGLRVVGPSSRAYRSIALTAIGIAVVMAVCTPYVIVARALGEFGGTWAWALFWFLNPALFFSAAAVAASAYVFARGEARRRMAWIFFGTFPYVACIAILNLPFFVTFRTDAWFTVMLRAFELTFPVSLAYGLLFRRVIDLGFVFNRVAVYGITSLLLGGLFVLLEFAVGRVLLDSGRTGSLVVQLLGALAIGLSSRYLHNAVDRIIDRIVFARRHADETALRRFAREAHAFMGEAPMLDRAVAVLSGHTEARGVAIYVPDGLQLRALRRTNEDFPPLVSIDDELAVAARAWSEPVDTHDAPGAFPDGMLFPMIAHGRFSGIVACETKRDYSAYDPDERSIIEAVAKAIAEARLSLNRAGDDVVALLVQMNEKLDRLSTKTT